MTTDLQDGGAEAPADDPDEAPEPARPGRGLLIALLAAVNLPIVVATVRALSRGWMPIGDDGILLVRVRDVGTQHNPLLGSWTSASLVVGDNLNNPGPIYFDLVAPWVRVLGPWVGVAVGVMVLNIVASSAAVVLARRISGVESMVAVAVAVVGLQFVMGSELLFAIWQPHALMLPFLLFLVVVTVLARGELMMVPWAVVVGTVLVQTHMSYAILVGALGLGALVAGVLTTRRGGGPVRWRTAALWSLGLAVVLWAQPVVEQFTGRGDGNLSRIAAASGGGDAGTIGWSRGLRLMAEIMVRGPWFSRTGFDEAIPPTLPDAELYAVVTTTTAVIAAVAVVGALVAVSVWAARSGRRDLATFGVTGIVVLVVGYVGLATSPVNVIAIVVHQMRWLWPVAAFVTAILLTALLVAVRRWERPQRALVGAVAAAVVVIALVTLPTHRSTGGGPTVSYDFEESAVELADQLGSLEGRGPILWDSDLVFAEPFSGLIFAELQDRGIPFVFDDEVNIRQFGEGRRNDGSARLRMWEVVGPGADEVPEGTERVAYVEGGPWTPVALYVEPID